MKSKSHIYMANILRCQFIYRGGYFINGRKYKLPKDAEYAINCYPNYYRAGAVGPDFFPDMFFGQTKIHPEESGLILNRMRDVLSRYNKKSTEYYPAYAFYLGYLTHYATDLFGHEDVNYYALGVFPDVGDTILKLLSIGNSDEGFEDLSIIVRHIMVETYMDTKVPLDENLDIEVPFDYVRRCFCTYEAYNFMAENHLLGGGITSLNVLPYLLENYISAMNKSRTRAIEKREEYINGWLHLWSTFTKLDIQYGIKVAYQKCEQGFKNLLINYVSSFLGAEGVVEGVETVLNILGIIGDVATSILTLGLNKTMSGLSDAIGYLFETILTRIILRGVVKSLGGTKEERKNIASCKKYLKDRFDDPRIVLNNDRFFEEHNKKVKELAKDETNEFYKYCQRNDIINPMFSDYLDYKWANYGEVDDIDKQKYIEFKRCLKMGALCLIGANNLNQLFGDITKKDKYLTFKGDNTKYGVYHISVDVRTSGDYYSGTDSDVFLEIGDGYENYKFLLDHGGTNDFERNKRSTYELYLHEFIPFNQIKSVIVTKANGDFFKIDSIRVKDLDTGLLIAKGSDLLFDSNTRRRNLIVYKNLESIAKNIEKNDRPYIGGLYVIFDSDSTYLDKKLTIGAIDIHANLICEEKVIIDRVLPSGIGIAYVPFYCNSNDVSAYYCSLSGKSSISNVSIYNANDFGFISYISYIANDNIKTNFSVDFDTFPSMNYIYTTNRLEVIIKTADSAYAGTNDDVFIEVVMNDGKVHNKQLNSYVHDDFEIGLLDVYDVELDETIDMQYVKEFNIYKKMKSEIGDWTVEFVAIVDKRYKCPYLFHKMSGPTVLEGEVPLKITDGYWKRLDRR